MSSNRKLIITSGVIAILLLCIFLLDMSRSLKKENLQLRSQKNEFLMLKNEYVLLKNRVDSVEGKKSTVKTEGIVQAIDEVFKSIGLAQKIKSVKPLNAKEKEFAFEEEADVQVERVSMNDMINIFHKIENAPMILSIKKTTMKTAFDSPTLLNITMTISLIKPK